MTRRQYFGTDGIRGRVGSPFMNPDFMEKLGLATGLSLAQENKPTVLIGRDTRESGEVLEASIQAGLLKAGVHVKLLGILPTPVIAYLTRFLQASIGIVISASHNPYQDNGVKFFDDKGMKLSDSAELVIEEKLDAVETLDLSHSGSFEQVDNAAEPYIQFCKNTFLSQQDLKGFKLVLDCANGACYDVAPKIFGDSGAELVVIHDLPDGKNINEYCGATRLRSLQGAVKEHQADVGLAFDGDGDRLMMVDRDGEVVDGDEILCILAKDQTPQWNKPVGIVGTVMSNLGLEQALAADGIAFERASVGDRYVLEALLEKGWMLGGEASGHIVNLHYTTTGDGVMTGLQVLGVMCAHKKPLHQLKKLMVKRPQVLINVPVTRFIDMDGNPVIARAVQKVEERLKGEGRVLLRPSGTEPLIRVMVEGEDENVVRESAEFIASIIRTYVKKNEDKTVY